MLGDERRQPRGDGFLHAAVALARSRWNREAEQLAVDPAEERLHFVDEADVPGRDEVAPPLGPDREEIGVTVEELLDHPGHVRPGAGINGAVELFLGEGGETGQVAGDRTGPFVEGEHGFEFVLELVAGAGLVGELEADGGFVFADLADDPLIGEFAAGAGEGVPGGEFAGDVLIEPGGLECGDQRGVRDRHAAAGPGDHFAEQVHAAGDRERDGGPCGDGHGTLRGMKERVPERGRADQAAVSSAASRLRVWSGTTGRPRSQRANWPTMSPAAMFAV